MGDASAPRLFTPGPLTTHPSVREAMNRDLGSRSPVFIELVKEIRSELLRIAGSSTAEGYEAIPMQGSGTFVIESVLGTMIPEQGKLLILKNGAYGERMCTIAHRLGIEHIALQCPENEVHDLGALGDALAEDITHVAVVHCETTTGILNPIEEIAAVVADAGKILIIDAMSSFGGYPIHIDSLPAHALVSSSNKCIEGTPGFGYAIVHRETLLETRGTSRSVSLDLLEQWETLEKTGQFRFTPPTHVLLGFHAALKLLSEEGGVEQRAARYRRRNDLLIEGMKRLGFEPYISSELRSHIITTFRYPKEDFDFNWFYEQLVAKELVIYPGKITEIDCFRIGNIGYLQESDISELLEVIGTLSER